MSANNPVLQHKMYLKIEEEFNVYCKETDTIKFNPADDCEMKNLEFSLSLTKKKIKDIDSKRKKLQEYVYKNRNVLFNSYNVLFKIYTKCTHESYIYDAA